MLIGLGGGERVCSCIDFGTAHVWQGLCAGKSSVADFLVQQEGFRRLDLVPQEHDDASADYTKVKTNNCIRFQTCEALLDFATKHWEQRWVLQDIRDEAILNRLQHRPSFILVSVDAPMSLRWARLAAQYAWHSYLGNDSETRVRYKKHGRTPPSLESFVLRDDANLHDHGRGLACVIDRAEVRLLNQSSSLHQLFQALKELDLADHKRLRPNWDEYFMHLASLAARRSNCMKRRVGCVLVRDRRVISTGYNGTPRYLKNCNEGGCKQSRHALSYWQLR